jgi:O-antigen ligase
MSASVFYALLTVIALTAIPYGAAEPWWKALADCSIFAIAALALAGELAGERAAKRAGELAGGFETERTARPQKHYRQLLLPLFALIAFALIQTVPFSGPSTIAGVSFSRTISADAFQTQLFVIHLLALIAAGVLIVRYTSSTQRLTYLIQTIIIVGLLSAAFGLWRQAAQHTVGFVLPYLRPGLGYGQFINSNHFAFLIEMTLGLTLGIVVCRGVSGARLILYLLAAMPMWAALVLANSRGALISMICQAVFLAALFVSERVSDKSIVWMESSRVRRAVLQLVLIATLLAGAIATVVVVGGDPLAGRIDSLSIEFDRKTAETYTLRQNVWSATWDLIKDHPFAGVGFGGYWIAIAKYHHASGETTPQQAHSDYLELLASGGVIGISIGVWFLIIFTRTAYRRIRAADKKFRAVKLGAVAGLIAISIHSLVDFGLHIPINALICVALMALVVMDQGKLKHEFGPSDDDKLLSSLSS